jgi:hypothetical protein
MVLSFSDGWVWKHWPALFFFLQPRRYRTKRHVRYQALYHTFVECRKHSNHLWQPTLFLIFSHWIVLCEWCPGHEEQLEGESSHIQASGFPNEEMLWDLNSVYVDQLPKSKEGLKSRRRNHFVLSILSMHDNVFIMATSVKLSIVTLHESWTEDLGDMCGVWNVSDSCMRGIKPSRLTFIIGYCTWVDPV